MRAFLAAGSAPLDEVIERTGFARNAVILACKEAANASDKTRKRFEILCRQVFRSFKACINVDGVNAHRADRDAINIIYLSLQRDREQADIGAIMRQLHQVVDEAIETRPDRVADSPPYDISQIDFERLKRELAVSPRQHTTVQNLSHAIEQRLARMLQQNPLRTDFQLHYEQIVADYNREKDGITIERTFEGLLRFVQELGDEDSRGLREGLDEESLAVFDLLTKPSLSATERQRIKTVASELLATLKAEKLRIDQWRDKEATRDAVRLTIHDTLWSEDTGLPVDRYSEDDVADLGDDVYRHVFRAYPVVPSPYYRAQALS